MAHLRLGVLGSLQIVGDDVPISTFESDKARALLIYLAVESPQPHRRDALVALLWPDSSEEKARSNFRQNLYNLRQAIGDARASPPYLFITRQEIQFNPASRHTLDLATFETHLATVATHNHTHLEECDSCAARLKQATELYRGKFLQEFFLSDSAEFEEWALLHRESLHRCALQALAHLANYHEKRGEYKDACGFALRQLELEPWWEEAHRQVMRTLAASGERSAALAQYEICRHLLNKELGVEPSAETRDLNEQIARGEPAVLRREFQPAAWTPPSPLVQLTPFIGRESELAHLAELLTNPECRLITLVGIGGIGKTRLALEAAERHRALFAQGTVFVSLASANSSELVVSAIAEALGLVFPGSRDPRDLVLRYLHDKQILLVLDNLEHLPESVGLFVEILQSAPGTKLLCTARQGLDLQNEWVYPVEGLDVPENRHSPNFDNYPAVALFIQHARRARVRYTLSDEERTGIARIVHLVGGMPLALELAASWLRVLSSQEIADHIERDICFLTASIRDLPARHCCIRAVFDETWGMLASEERRVLSQLSVFQGGWRRRAAEQVAGTSLSVLASLVSKSLVRRIETDRYDMHELIRQYSSARLAGDSVEEAAARDRHSEHYLTLVEQEERRLCSNQQKTSLAELAPEIANIRLALGRAIDLHQMGLLRQVSFPLLYLYEIRGWYRDAESLFRDAAAKVGTLEETYAEHERDRQIAQLDMQTNQAYFASRIGRIAEANGMLRQCSEQLRSLGDRTVLRYALRYCGITAQSLGRLDEAELCLDESLELSQTVNRPWDIGIDNVYLGSLARVRGELDKAQTYFYQALEISRKLGDPRLLAVNLNGLGFVHLSLNRPTQARELAEEALSHAQETGDRYDLALSMVLLGDVAVHLGDPAKAHVLFEKSIALLLETGDTLNVIGTYTRQGHLALSMDKAREAEAHFRAAASLAMQGGSEMLTINALAGLASARARIGAAESAMDLVVFVLHHPSSPVAARDLAERLCPELEAQLTPAQIEAIELRMRVETWEDITQRLAAIN
jgi:DNA-binding SARP family transcriptional activator/Tfp pilus assembly protein PilF